MKRQLFRAAAVLFAAAFFTTLVSAKENYSARYYVLMDGDTGEILCGKGIHEQALIASTTKIMTAMLAIENLDPNMLFVVPAQAVGIEGSSVYLREGEQITVKELLYGLMLHSGNDAAVALALAVDGSVKDFVFRMNLKAQELGMSHTHFDNPNGLDSKSHYSTAHDLAVLTREALRNSAFREVVGEKEITIGSRSFRNHNRLLWMGDGILGVKTGYTRAAGRILVSAACRKGRTLIAVTICDGNDWVDHLNLYEQGFSLYDSRCLINKGQVLCHVPLMDGSLTALRAGESVYYASREDEMPIIKLSYPQVSLTPQGTAIAHVYLGNLKIKTLKLEWEDTDYGTNPKNHSFSGTVLPKDC